MSWRKLVPKPLRSAYWGLRNTVGLKALARRLAPTRAKQAAELAYWRSRWEQEGRNLGNSHYEKLMLAMAGEKDASFLAGKVVADFGCGPRGSLCWATQAKARIGIDVLADAYAEFGIDRHDMSYVRCTERSIPLPSGHVDVLFTLNALDHVAHFEVMCREILRVLRPGGDFIGSINLGKSSTISEPQCLTAQGVQDCLLSHLKVGLYRLAPKGPEEDTYRYFFEEPPEKEWTPRILWVRAGKTL